jgi:hypothetical protein
MYIPLRNGLIGSITPSKVKEARNATKCWGQAMQSGEEKGYITLACI